MKMQFAPVRLGVIGKSVAIREGHRHLLQIL
jgi:hypothetical protein